MLKGLVKDAVTVVAVFVCTVAVIAVLFVVTYGLMLLAGWLFLSFDPS